MRIFKYLFYLIFLFFGIISAYAFIYELPAPSVNVAMEVTLPND